MKTIICGSRTITDWRHVQEAINECPWEITGVISGHAPGADTLGEEYATEMCLPLEVYPARWDLYGTRAEIYRNELMLGKAEAVLAVWDGESPGTKHMIRIAEREKIPVHVYRVYILREHQEKVNNGR